MDKVDDGDLEFVFFAVDNDGRDLLIEED